MQSSCSSGRAPIGLILMIIFIEKNSWLLGNSIDKMDFFVLALVSSSVLRLSCRFGFMNHLLKYFSRHLHSLVCEPWTFQLTISPQGHENCCFLVSLIQSTGRSQVYPSQILIANSYSIYHDGIPDFLNKLKVNV